MRKTAIPPGWPERLQCPNCGTWEQTAEFTIFGTQTAVKELMNYVVACRSCSQIFSPRQEYLTLMAAGTSALPQRPEPIPHRPD